MVTHLVSKDDLPYGGTAHCFEGHEFGSVNISFFLNEGPPGTGPSLHRHPYDEVFVVQEGCVVFTVGDQTIEVTGGQIVIAPAGQPHKFVNVGPGLARHLDIHTSERMITEWLDD